jgi:integrase
VATITKYEGKGKISWQVKVRKGGQSHAASFPSKKQAEDWSRDLENQIVNEKYFPERAQRSHSRTVGELIDLYVDRILPQKAPATQRNQRKMLQWWNEVLGDTPLNNLTVARLEPYKYFLLNQKHYAPGTVNFFLNTISSCFSYAASPRLGWIASNPFQHIKRLPEPKRMPMLTHDELVVLLWHCGQSKSPHLYLFVRLVLATGGRHHSEVLSLRWRQINFIRRTVMFLNTKGKEDRVVPLDNATCKLLGDHFEKLQNTSGPYHDVAGVYPKDFLTQPVFLSTVKPGFPVRSINTAWHIARKKAGLPKLTIHDLRHVAASRWAEQGGADLATLAELLGHKNLKHTQRYRHVTQNHNAAIVEKTAELTFNRDFDVQAQRKTP